MSEPAGKRLLQHEPSLGVQRILMMDYASTQARTKGVARTASREEGHTKAAMTRPLKASPPPAINGVDKMYCQLEEIHAISTVQRAECVRYHRSNPTPSVAHTGTGWRGPAMESSTTRMAPPRQTNFSPQASLQQRGPRVEPQACRWAHQVGAQLERCTRNPHHDKPRGQRRHGRDPRGQV
jgi:hypothetical protein